MCEFVYLSLFYPHRNTRFEKNNQHFQGEKEIGVFSVSFVIFKAPYNYRFCVNTSVACLLMTYWSSRLFPAGIIFLAKLNPKKAVEI